MSDVKKRIIDYETAGEVNEDFYLLGDNGTEGTFKIPVKAVGPIESICPVYDAEAGTYDEGDYCFYDQKMYQCNTDISVPEDFDSTKWDEVTIAEIMASQQSQISTINQSLTQKLTKTWTQLSGTISENVNIPIGNDYTEIHIDCAMSNGTVLQFDIQIIPNYGTIRRDEGYYYNSSTCGGGAVSFNTSTRNLVIYSPYMGGSASSYSAIKVFVR